MKTKSKLRAGGLAETEGISEMGDDHWKLVTCL